LDGSEEGFLTSEELEFEDELPVELFLPEVSELLFLSPLAVPTLDVLPVLTPVLPVSEADEASLDCDTSEDEGLSDTEEPPLISDFVPFFLQDASSAHTASKVNTDKNTFFIFLPPNFVYEAVKAPSLNLYKHIGHSARCAL